jgi:CBS domain-containing protein
MSPSSTTPQSRVTGMDVAAAMHRGVLTVPAGRSPHDLAVVMAANDIHALVVTDGDQTRVCTDLDVVAAALDGADEVQPQGSALPSVAADAPLAEAVEAMVREDVGHVLVVSGDDLLPAGVVSSFDVAAVVAGRSPSIARLARPTAARPALSENRLERLIVADVMHSGVIGVGPATSLRDLAAVLADRHVHAVSVAGTAPAAGGTRLVWAIATDMDVVRAVGAGSLDATAGQIAGTEPLVVDAGDPLDTAARMLVDHAVSHAVVTGDAAVPAGVLSTLDVLRVLAITR